jgi:ArsR family transcriptional regulator
MLASARVAPKRWEFYRLLADPVRLRLLRLVREEELTIGELADLIGESQPTVSRQLKKLRERGLVSVRRQGAYAFCRLSDGLRGDAVLADALRAGNELCEAEGSLNRISAVVAARDEASREYFARHKEDAQSTGWPEELPAYLMAIAPLLRVGRLAFDAGTGGGEFVEVLAPLFERVVAVDREAQQVERARERVRRRGYRHVELMQADFSDPKVEKRVQELGGADAIFATRVLHHAPRPVQALRALAKLGAPGAALVVLDYVEHQDQRLRDEQADYWLGFDAEQLRAYARDAGLENPAVNLIPAQRTGAGPDGHLDWQVLIAYTPDPGRE